MEYSHIEKGIFLSRPNRFIAKVNLGGREVTCHVKNTGRCRELLIPNASVLVEFHPEARAAGRKTSYSLISVYKGDTLVNMDSQAPNQVAFEWLLRNSSSGVRREVKFGDSRFDLAFTADKYPAFMEVKGVTLESDGVARFPDAPTERGVKHVRELTKAVSQGFEAYILFVIQMKGCHLFEPNMDTHPEFGLALRDAARAGVHILAYDCLVTETGIDIDAKVPVGLPEHAPNTQTTHIK